MTLSTEQSLRDKPLPYTAWGLELVDPDAVKQLENAARLPISRAAALMPDAHVGYGLPIGGVLATEGAVIPYAVGVDIACRMRLSIGPPTPELLDEAVEELADALRKGSRFGVGSTWEKGRRAEHEVMDDPTWRLVETLPPLKATAHKQLGTSGGGNHFVEWGMLEILVPIPEIGLQPGMYVALLSHSGSRGMGARTAEYYSRLAQSLHPELPKEVRHLAWLDLDSHAGQSYWAAMELAGQYAAANHAIIHQRVLAEAGIEPLAHVENHHNYAWRETLPDGTSVIVHRKGATPAGPGVLGVIPGSMGDAGYVIRGKGSAAALNSAAHGAGRRLGRSQAFRTLDPADWRRYLAARGITLIGGSLDEAPQAYKDIDEVMDAQSDLVEPVARFMPRIVRMAAGGRRRGKRKGKRKKRR